MIPLLKPNPPGIDKWSKYLQMSYDQNSFSNGGPCVKLLESRLQKYLGLSTTPILMCNATVALTVVLQAMGVKESTVVLPSFTFSATPLSVLNAECFPYLVDCGDDLQTDLTDLEKNIKYFSHKCSSLVVVQALGYACDYKKYEYFAKKHNLKLIFDSAALLGADYEDGLKVGSAGDCEVFSLHITKTFGIGEGALVTSKDQKLLDACRQIINFGFVNNQTQSIGTNAKCSEFHAAVGLSVLDEIDEKLARKKTVYERYQKLLGNLPIRILEKNSAYQVFPIIFESKEIRDKVKDALHKNNISTRLYYIPIHRQPYFEFTASDMSRFAKTDYYADRILCIPFFETLSEKEQETISSIISDTLYNK